MPLGGFGPDRPTPGVHCNEACTGDGVGSCNASGTPSPPASTDAINVQGPPGCPLGMLGHHRLRAGPRGGRHAARRRGAGGDKAHFVRPKADGRVRAGGQRENRCGTPIQPRRGCTKKKENPATPSAPFCHQAGQLVSGHSRNRISDSFIKTWWEKCILSRSVGKRSLKTLFPSQAQSRKH